MPTRDTDPPDPAAGVGADFIRRAIELADLNAVRLALYQQTGDPELPTLGTAEEMSDVERRTLVDKAVAWLLEHAGPGRPDEPTEEDLRALCTMATGRPMTDLEFAARRELPAFADFPMTASWRDRPPPLPEGFTVAIVGSGFSGIAMGVQLELLGIPYVVLESQPEPGGTWSIHRYPGIRVDTTSITYEFSFEKDHRWSEYFSPGAEVLRYLDGVADTYGVKRNTRFEHRLTRATWRAERSTWQLDLDTPRGPTTLEATVLVNAVGTFANPKLPDIDGLEHFAGEIIHPSRWPADADLSGARVAIVGNGSTGVQLLKPIAAEAVSVSVFQRTPQWIAPRPRYGEPVEPEIRWLLDNFAGYWNWWRYMAIAALFDTHELLLPDPEWVAAGGRWNEVNDQLRADLTAYVEAKTAGHPHLTERLVPDYAPFSRRLVVDNDWYETLLADHVELVTDPIVRVVPSGIETADGAVRDVDVIICATGFDLDSYLATATYIGTDGVDLQSFWSPDGPRAYLSMLVPHFPNMFTIYGPNSQPLSGGTGLPLWYVLWSSYIAKCVMGMLEAGADTVEVSPEAFRRYNEELDAAAADLLLLHPEGAPDRNYYVNRNGRLQVNAPWYGPEYHRRCSEVDWDDVVLGFAARARGD